MKRASLPSMNCSLNPQSKPAGALASVRSIVTTAWLSNSSFARSSKSLPKFCRLFGLSGLNVGPLAVDRLIESEFFVRIFNPHDCDAIDDPQHSQGENKRPGGGKKPCPKLLQKEARIAGEQSVHTAVGRWIPCG